MPAPMAVAESTCALREVAELQLQHVSKYGAWLSFSYSAFRNYAWPSFGYSVSRTELGAAKSSRPCAGTERVGSLYMARNDPSRRQRRVANL